MLVNGSVYEFNGDSLPGANVVEVGTHNGVSTDENGNYTINVPSAITNLQISFIGYKTITIPASEANSKSVFLNQSAEEIEEVVVTGHKKKADYTLWYILVGLAVLGITIKALSKPKPQPVKV